MAETDGDGLVRYTGAETGGDSLFPSAAAETNRAVPAVSEDFDSSSRFTGFFESRRGDVEK